MGQFSWIACDDKKSILDNELADVYLLIPAEFGGGYHHEKCYDGYGNFGGVDVYAEVAKWNKKYLSKLDIQTTDSKEPSPWELSQTMLDDFINLTESEFIEKYDENTIRIIGIEIACEDEDNGHLPYPIKISHTPMRYEDATPSISDLNQGWGCNQDECKAAYDEFMEAYNKTYKQIGENLRNGKE